MIVTFPLRISFVKCTARVDVGTSVKKVQKDEEKCAEIAECRDTFGPFRTNKELNVHYQV